MMHGLLHRPLPVCANMVAFATSLSCTMVTLCLKEGWHSCNSSGVLGAEQLILGLNLEIDISRNVFLVYHLPSVHISGLDTAGIT